MCKTMADVKKVREIADRLDVLGVPRKTTDKIRTFATNEQKRLRNEARAEKR